MSISPEVRDKIERECNALARAERGRRLIQMIRVKRSNGWLVIRSNLTGKRSNADEFQGAVVIGECVSAHNAADDTWEELFPSQSQVSREAHIVPDVMLFSSDTSTASYPQEEKLPEVSVVPAVKPKLATAQDFGIKEEPRKRKTQRKKTLATVKK